MAGSVHRMNEDTAKLVNLGEQQLDALDKVAALMKMRLDAETGNREILYLSRRGFFGTDKVVSELKLLRATVEKIGEAKEKELLRRQKELELRELELREKELLLRQREMQLHRVPFLGH